VHALLAATQGNAALLVGLALAAGFAVIAALLSERTRGRYLPVICLIAAIGYYGAGATGFVLDIAIAYPAVHWLGAQRDAGMRWRAACLFMLVLGALFTAGRAAHASPFVVALDMWLVLRLVTLVWEVGSGAVNPPSPSQYVAWTCLPLTLAGPLLRYSEFVVHRDPRSSADAWVRCLATGLLKLVAGIGLSVADRAVTFALPMDTLPRQPSGRLSPDRSASISRWRATTRRCRHSEHVPGFRCLTVSTGPLGARTSAISGQTGT
jgi:predicted outer membrane lipoprotein